MNKLEEIHFNLNQEMMLGEQLAKKSAEITTDVAVKFERFLGTLERTRKEDYWLYKKPTNDFQWYTAKELFEEFVNNHYGK